MQTAPSKEGNTLTIRHANGNDVDEQKMAWNSARLEIYTDCEG